MFLDRLGEVQRDYVKDYAAARAAWELLLSRALARRVERADLAEVRARLGLSDAWLGAGDARRALDFAAHVVTAAPPAPYGAISDAHFAMARAYERLGDRSRAIAALDLAIAHAPKDDPARIVSRARAMKSRLRSAR
jgi:tetratricopeptide (TPR) repeat protein